MEPKKVEQGNGEQVRIAGSNSNNSNNFLLKLRGWIPGSSPNKVGALKESRDDDFPPEAPSHALTSDDIDSFDEWLQSTDNFFIKPRRKVSNAIKITGVKSYACYDVCNAKNGVFFSLCQTSPMPSHSKKDMSQNADPVNYILVNRKGRKVLSTEGDLQNSERVNIWVKGIKRGYIEQHGNENYSLFNRSNQLVFLIVWNGHSNVIIMGNADNKSPPMGEMCRSLTGVHRLTVGSNLPATLNAMLLGVHIVVMHKQLSSESNWPFEKKLFFGLVFMVFVSAAITFYWRM